MKVLVIGSGGREHAIIKSLKKSDEIDKIYCAPGNGGISLDATIVPISAMDKEKIKEFCLENNIQFAVVAPDDPLADGMVDVLESEGIKCFGPNKNAARIESSKIYAKELMKKYNIPTASYETFNDFEKANEYILNKNEFPIVIKADGLALGKGVIIAKNKDEAQDSLKEIMVDKKFGSSGNKVVIEEFLEGPEVSILTFCDGKTIKPMISSMDHKRALDNDMGLNTGGMGTIAPNPYYTKEIEEICMEKIFKPTVLALIKENNPFKGCLYFGLMLTKKGPMVIEYNCRFGDPEAQTVLSLLKTDLFKIFKAVSEQKLDNIDIEFYDKSAACVMITAGGYPLSYKKGDEIFGISNLESKNITIFHSGTIFKDNKFYTNGGRVLGVSCVDNDLKSCLDNVYKKVNDIKFDNSYYRKDIGKLALKILD